MTAQTSEPRAELLTITEAAELLRSPVATLRYWRHLGTGPHSFKIGRHVLYRRGDIENWVADLLDRSASPAAEEPSRSDRGLSRP